ncbi:IS200/IS605 family transposase [Candidatus Enterovibrio escicola]|uniref:IS200/IS605 family transposase n=1 Tax=Candidatus Enterovibrio escicola TaxID=1927127 RepID=UPI001238371E|nr:IS200/IS605 family transposase [Candidatus Enterovibrio escacola]
MLHESIKCELIEFGGEDNHVHMMVAVRPTIAVASLVGKLKGESSYMIRREFWDCVKTMHWGNHFWSPSYCVVSCGGASLDVVKKYIESQNAPPNERSLRASLAANKRKSRLLLARPAHE